MTYYVQKRGANHMLHLLLSIFTCGLWAVTGWPIAAIIGRKTTTTGTNRQQTVWTPPPPQQQQPPLRQQYPPPPPYPPGQ